MEWLHEGKWCLFFIVLILLALGFIIFILGKFRYELHISAKKIEILPTKESPLKKH